MRCWNELDLSMYQEADLESAQKAEQALNKTLANVVEVCRQQRPDPVLVVSEDPRLVCTVVNNVEYEARVIVFRSRDKRHDTNFVVLQDSFPCLTVVRGHVESDLRNMWLRDTYTLGFTDILGYYNLKNGAGHRCDHLFVAGYVQLTNAAWRMAYARELKDLQHGCLGDDVLIDFTRKAGES